MDIMQGWNLGWLEVLPGRGASDMRGPGRMVELSGARVCATRSRSGMFPRLVRAIAGLLAIMLSGLVPAGGLQRSIEADDFVAQWPGGLERPWIGADFWANRLTDWRLRDGRVECLESSAGRPLRTLQLLTAALGAEPGELVMSVRMGALQSSKYRSADTWAGFLVGAGGVGIDYRTTALVHQRSGEDGGILIAVDGTGKVILRSNHSTGDPESSSSAAGPLRSGDLAVLAPASRSGTGFNSDEALENVELRVEAKPSGDTYTLTATALLSQTGKVISSAELRRVAARDLEGSVALVSHGGPPGTTLGYWFRDWKLAGRKVVLHPERAFGPILGTQYTVHRGILKLTAQLPPLSDKDQMAARLEVRAGDDQPWRLAGRATVNRLSGTLNFRVEKWDGSRDQQYRVVYEERGAGEASRTVTWPGIIRRPPVDRDQFVVAALADVRSYSGGLKWNSQGLWFPHADLVKSIAHHRPDLLFFAGNQVDDTDLTGAQRQPHERAQLDYLDKWFQWYWAFGELTRSTPTICLPSTHDYFQTRLFGAAGRGAKSEADAGFVMSPEFVNLVQATQTSHLPDPVDSLPVEQNIGVHFGRLDYAGISFAILEDRKFKSSPRALLPEGRYADGVFQNPRFDPARDADVAGAELLGDRQLRFLRDWAADWGEGTWMKVALSSTLFAGVATVPKETAGDPLAVRARRLSATDYPSDDRVIADPDMHAWPQTGRNQALRELRRGFALHLAGNHHLGTLLRYGVDEFDDSGFGFGVPATAQLGMRRWYPAESREERGAEAIAGEVPKYAGRFRDGFGNRMTIQAVANPVASNQLPAALHDRAPGYGIVRLSRESRTVTCECWPRHVDPSQPNAQQYPGWPVTIAQQDNFARAAAARLPTLEIRGLKDAVVQVMEEGTREVVYTLRIAGDRFQPKVFREGTYTVKVGEPGTAQMRSLVGLEAKPDNSTTILVEFSSSR